jgi:hypothetical protein
MRGNYNRSNFITPSQSLISVRYLYKKVKLFCYTPWRLLGGEEVQLLLILNLGTRWGWVVSITPWPRFTPVERTPGTHWSGGWVVPRAGLDAEARRKSLCFCRGSNPGRPVRSQTLYWLSYPDPSGIYSSWNKIRPVSSTVSCPSCSPINTLRLYFHLLLFLPL